MSQLALLSEATEPETARTNATANRLGVDDRAVHDWHRFVLSFPPHVEAKLQGLAAVGIEADALAHFAGSVKTDWSVDPAALLRCYC
ncbi:MAG: hypothetical protein IAE81_05275 [Caldilineaceae bacterium]|jgi:hypothetical protein|nr:hypothetical protein [Caldilineaceae bacterium]